MNDGRGGRTLDRHHPPPEGHVMGWVALLVWITVASLALPVAAGALSGVPGLGMQAVAAIGGLVFCALFIILDGPLWTGWLAVGMAVVGIMTDLWGAETLLSGERVVSA